MIPAKALDLISEAREKLGRMRGYDRAVLASVEDKLRMAELMLSMEYYEEE